MSMCPSLETAYSFFSARTHRSRERAHFLTNRQIVTIQKDIDCGEETHAMASLNQVTALSYPTGNVQFPQMQMVNPVGNTDLSKSYLKKIRGTAIVTLIGGVLMVLFGVVTMILWGYWSFFAVPLWCGIGFYIVTGSLGIKASQTRKHSWIKAYIVMSIVSCIVAAGLATYYSLVAIFELGQYEYYDYTWICNPGGYNSRVTNCPKSEAARITFDALIATTALVLFFVTMVSASYGCCATCRCCATTCRNCCRNCCGEGCATCCCGGGGCESCCAPSPQTTVAFNGIVNGQIQGGIQLQNQPMMYVVQSNQAPQYQQVAAPPGVMYPPAGAPIGAMYPSAGAPGGVVYPPGGAPGTQTPVQGYPAAHTNQMTVTMPTPQPPPPQYQAIAASNAMGQNSAAAGQLGATNSSNVNLGKN